MKGLLLGIPSVGMCNTLHPVLKELAKAGHRLIAYNHAQYPPSPSRQYTFKPYPSYTGGYHPACVDENSSYLQFGELLVDTAISLNNFLLNEVQKEKPDYIMHSHLAIWGRLVAEHYNIPSIPLFTTFVLDKKIMLFFFNRNRQQNYKPLDHVRHSIRFRKKLNDLHQRLQLSGEPDIWDIYVNRVGLNLSFIPSCFQPERESLEPECKFLGYPGIKKNQPVNREIIYVSMGTIFNRNMALYKLFLDVLKQLPYRSVLVVGKTTDINSLGTIPPNIEVVPFTDQVKRLQQSVLFITRGGMASVQEAVYSHTPMIVIPEMAEQQMTAEIIEKLGIGIQLPAAQLSGTILLQAIQHVLQNQTGYAISLQSVLKNIPKENPGKAASRLITSYLQNRNVFA